MLNSLTRDQLAFLLFHTQRRTLRFYRDWLERIALESGIADRLPLPGTPTATEDAIDQMVADQMAMQLLAGETEQPLISLEEFGHIVEKACRATLPVIFPGDPDIEKKVVATVAFCVTIMHNRFVPWTDVKILRKEIETVLTLSHEAMTTPDRFLARAEAWDEVILRMHSKQSFTVLALARQCAVSAETASNKAFVITHEPGKKPTPEKAGLMVAQWIQDEVLREVDELRPYLEREVKRLWPDKTDIQ